ARALPADRRRIGGEADGARRAAPEVSHLRATLKPMRQTGAVNEVVLSAEGLAKRYGEREVVTDATFQLHAGEVFGFLGPNGAGKTTTIRMLVGLVKPTRGRVVIEGKDPARDFENAMRHVGCIVETPSLYGFLTGRENLEHFARMLGAEA